MDSSSSSHAVVLEPTSPRRLARRAWILHKLAHGMHTWGGTDREQQWHPGALPADGDESPTTVDINSLVTHRPQAASDSATFGTGMSDFHSFHSVIGAKPVLRDRVMRQGKRGPLELGKATGKVLGNELLFSPQSPPKPPFRIYSPESTTLTTNVGNSPQKSSLKRAGFYNSSRKHKNVCWTEDEVLLFLESRCVLSRCPVAFRPAISLFFVRHGRLHTGRHPSQRPSTGRRDRRRTWEEEEEESHLIILKAQLSYRSRSQIPLHFSKDS